MTPEQLADLGINCAAAPDHAAGSHLGRGRVVGWFSVALILAAGALGWWVAL
jgi:hypothetical protein